MDLGIEVGEGKKDNKQLNKATPFFPLSQAQLNTNTSASLIFGAGLVQCAPAALVR